MVLDPSGSIVGETLSDSEGIVYADIDTSLSVEPKQFHDVVGYCNRFDIFDLRVDRSRRDPARFAEDALDVPAPSAGADTRPSAPRSSRSAKALRRGGTADGVAKR